MRIAFNVTETTVPLTFKDQLDALATQLKSNEDQRVTITAYASGSDEQASTARRVSLSRALAVRAYLIDQGVGNLRINVQAEGNKVPVGEAAGSERDRVDLFIHKPGEK